MMQVMHSNQVVPTVEQLMSRIESWRTGKSLDDWDNLVRGLVVDLYKGGKATPSEHEWQTLRG